MKSLEGLRVLALTPTSAYEGFNTSVHRVDALRRLGCTVHVVDSAITPDVPRDWERRLRHRLFRLGLPVPHPDPVASKRRLLEAAATGEWDLVWLERALAIDGRTMRRLRELLPDAMLVGFSPDDMNARHNQSYQFLSALPHYDWFLTTKSYNVAELRARGCPQVYFVANGYDPESFRPVDPHPDDRERLGGDVGFIGSYERERAQSMLYLAQNGLPVRIWGGHWEALATSHPNLKIEYRPLRGDDFARACQAFKINLGFLRKINRDQQTTRSVEVPACGGFMLAERTAEHQAMFHEGEEAEFFGSDEELLAKCRRYLADDGMRERIARRGRERCIASGYSNQERLQTALQAVLASPYANGA